MRQLIGFGIALLGGLVLVVATGLLVARHAPAAPVWIAFTSARTGNFDVYRMRPDGSDVQQLTTHERDDRTPTWSPDGRWLAFASSRNGYWQIYKMRADGSQLTRLTKGNIDNDPEWSPDGAWIVFMSERDYNEELYRVHADGSDLQRLTHHPARDYAPTWSPDGQWITFVSTRGGSAGVYRMRPDGSEVQPLVARPGQQFGAPGWSPDGRWVVLHDYVALYKMRPDGSDYRQMSVEQAGQPRWSPDGRWIVYTRRTGSSIDLFRMNADGGGVQQLTSHLATDFDPAWSPVIDYRWRGMGLVALAMAMLGAGLVLSFTRLW